MIYEGALELWMLNLHVKVDDKVRNVYRFSKSTEILTMKLKLFSHHIMRRSVVEPNFIYYSFLLNPACLIFLTG